MNTVRRLTRTITSSFDWVISQVENHDAVVESLIRDMQQSAVKVRLQLKRVQRDGSELSRKQEEALRQMELWRSRAINLKHEDETKALECLKRHKQSEKEALYFEKELRLHEEFEIKLRKDVEEIDSKIDELKRKKNSMKARAYRSEAFKYSEDTGHELVAEIDDVFDRWEVKIADFVDSKDIFEEEFVKEEELEELKAQLAELGEE